MVRSSSKSESTRKEDGCTRDAQRDGMCLASVWCKRVICLICLICFACSEGLREKNWEKSSQGEFEKNRHRDHRVVVRVRVINNKAIDGFSKRLDCLRYCKLLHTLADHDSAQQNCRPLMLMAACHKYSFVGLSLMLDEKQ